MTDSPTRNVYDDEKDNLTELQRDQIGATLEIQDVLSRYNLAFEQKLVKGVPELDLVRRD